jgi:hypothetical protein
MIIYIHYTASLSPFFDVCPMRIPGDHDPRRVSAEARRHSILSAKQNIEEISKKATSNSIRVSALHQKRIEAKMGDRVSRTRQEGFTGGDIKEGAMAAVAKSNKKLHSLGSDMMEMMKRSLREHPIFSNMDQVR